MKKAIDIPNAPTPVGSYSQAILNNGTLFISGQIPMDPVTKKVELLSIEKATHQVLKNIESLLNAAQMTSDDVVKCSIFLKDMNDFEIVNSIYSDFFQGVFPARETVQVARLPLDVAIEISCIASK
ncbi:Rid family detoxifying hydrolase [Crocinitomicaceae bacterium]|jgi:2-iminobutanoate/2-iminopropanoate deaminase|nr:Rid family detoxifying hydrolase [Crocinitomicaceae bacterium]MDB4649247.1 Rid family detoxifying hydrolase [Crocinitomicaceae bacterium]